MSQAGAVGGSLSAILWRHQNGAKWRTIPQQRHEAPVANPEGIWNNRNQVERPWAL